MHKLGSALLTKEDFQGGEVLPETLDYLNGKSKVYKETKDYSLVISMKRHLPESFLQLSTYHFNYEVALKIYHDRKNHRLPEWNIVSPGSFCSFLRTLPWMDVLLDL
jgi:hypothetical protein